MQPRMYYWPTGQRFAVLSALKRNSVKGGPCAVDVRFCEQRIGKCKNSGNQKKDHPRDRPKIRGEFRIRLINKPDCLQEKSVFIIAC